MYEQETNNDLLLTTESSGPWIKSVMKKQVDMIGNIKEQYSLSSLAKSS